VGYQTAAILLSSFTPVLATALVVWSHGALWPIVIFAIVTTVIAMVAVSFARDRRSFGLDQIGRVYAPDPEPQPAR